MATVKFGGIDKYILRLNTFSARSRATVKMAVYDGAAVVADGVRKELRKHRRTGALEESLYLAPMKDDNGFIYTEIGFAGTDARGVPNALKANVLEHGSSKQRKTPVVAPAVRACKAAAIAAMQKRFDAEAETIIEEES